MTPSTASAPLVAALVAALIIFVAPGCSQARTCGNNAGCAANQTCDVNGRCQTIPPTPPPPPPPPGTPASCADALAAGVTTSGVVTLDDGAGTAFDAWCEQSLAGGGWALALKVLGDAGTFRNNSAQWTSPALLNEASLDPGAGDEAKLEPFERTSVGAVLVAFAPLDAAAPTGSVVLDVHGSSLASLFASGDGFPSHAPRAAWLAAVEGAALQPSCGRQGLNLRRGTGAGMRIGMFGNGEVDCLTPDSSVGIGDDNPCANGLGAVRAGNIQNGGGTPASCIRSRAWVYVRDDDHTALGDAASRDAHRAAGALDDGLYIVGDEARRCDMTVDGGGWTAVLDFDAARGDACPGGLVSAFGAGAVPLACKLDTTATVASIPAPAPFPYHQVMARALAYQINTPDAFRVNGGTAATPDEPYVDGLSITRGPPGLREHVMTFAMAFRDPLPTAVCTACACPCNGGAAPPVFVGTAFRCEAGQGDGAGSEALSDPVWDGVDGALAPGCAVEQSGDPLVVDLGDALNDDLELRVLRDEVDTAGTGDPENFALYRVEIYVR